MAHGRKLVPKSGECSEAREGATMTVIIGNGNSGKKTEKKERDMQNILSVITLQTIVSKRRER